MLKLEVVKSETVAMLDFVDFVADRPPKGAYRWQEFAIEDGPEDGQVVGIWLDEDDNFVAADIDYLDELAYPPSKRPHSVLI